MLVDKDNLKRSISTNYDPAFARTKFMETVVATDYEAKEWVDPLDPRLLNLLSHDTPFTKYTYNSESMTTLSYLNYGTTSLWWLILMFNGFLHPHDIPSGYELKIPQLSFILAKIKSKAVNSIAGKIVTV